MSTVKTIQQHSTIYTIKQNGNCSYRVCYTGPNSTQIKHIPNVFASVKEAEEYISTCKSMDLVIKLGSK